MEFKRFSTNLTGRCPLWSTKGGRDISLIEKLIKIFLDFGGSISGGKRYCVLIRRKDEIIKVMLQSRESAFDAAEPSLLFIFSSLSLPPFLTVGSGCLFHKVGVWFAPVFRQNQTIASVVVIFSICTSKQSSLVIIETVSVSYIMQSFQFTIFFLSPHYCMFLKQKSFANCSLDVQNFKC